MALNPLPSLHSGLLMQVSSRWRKDRPTVYNVFRYLHMMNCVPEDDTQVNENCGWLMSSIVDIQVTRVIILPIWLVSGTADVCVCVCVCEWWNAAQLCLCVHVHTRIHTQARFWYQKLAVLRALGATFKQEFSYYCIANLHNRVFI